MKSIIEISEGVPRQPHYRLLEPINLEILEGEYLAITGATGAGKSIIAGIIAGAIPLNGVGVRYNLGDDASSSKIIHLAFRDSYGAQDKGYYHQQRWNATDREGQPTVAERLPACEDKALQSRLFSLFAMDSLLDKEMILLSSGELRRFQLVKALLAAPRVLIIEEPFIGLDVATRQTVSDLLAMLAKSTSTHIIMVLSRKDDIPPFITHIVPIAEGRCQVKLARTAYFENISTVPTHTLAPSKRKLIESLPNREWQHASDEIVALRDVTIRYGSHTILSGVNWSIRRGEKWALSGDNGAGKSTLLSLICADVPQGYACDVKRFGLRQGSGVSIWDIKRNIGYVSPEIHRAYCEPIPAIEIVASGLRDTVGLYCSMRDGERDICMMWLEVFGIESLSERSFTSLSSGEQRLVLLARAFVKDPELLILDEPLHGLDERNRAMVVEIVEAFTSRPNKSMIYVSHYKEELPTNITSSLYLTKPQGNQ